MNDSKLTKRDLSKLAGKLPKIPAVKGEKAAATEVESQLPTQGDIEKAIEEGIAYLKKEGTRKKQPKLKEYQLERIREESYAKLEKLMFSMAIDEDAIHYNLEKCSFVTQISGNNFYAIKDGRVILALQDLSSRDIQKLAMSAQMKDYIIELIGIIIGFIGLKPPSPDPGFMARVISRWASNSKFIAALQSLISSLRQKISNWEKAKYIMQFLRVCQSIGALIDFIKAYIHRMRWYHYALAVTQALAFLALAFGSGGLVVVAKWALVLTNCVYFGLKVFNIRAVAAIPAT